MPTLSVIIPIYNVEKYIKKCVDSVINQSYKDLEIILIDDGSKDNSGKICDNYSLLDNRVKVIHKSNEGQSSARNIGINICQGDYITFLDSDDWIEIEMYEILVGIIEKYNADISVCASRNSYINNNYIYNTENSGKIIEMSQKEVISDLYYNKYIRFEVWNKVFKKDLIGNCRFKEGQLFEEVYFDRIVFQKINKLIYYDKALHNYLSDRCGNTNSDFNNKKLFVFQEFEDFARDMEIKGENDIAQMLIAIEIRFAIILGLQAKEFKDKNKVKILNEKFVELYNNNKKNLYVNKKSVLLYKLSPFVYSKILDLKIVLRKKFYKFKNK